MGYTVRHAVREDFERIEEIYAYARRFMAAHGNPNQWGNTDPPKNQIEQDIVQNRLYVITEEKQIHGVFYFCIGEDPTYRKIHNGAWHEDSLYGTIHRIAGDGSGGILRTAVEFCKRQIGYLRMDTHEDNIVMQWALGKLGFQKCGMIYIEDGTERIAFDLLDRRGLC